MPRQRRGGTAAIDRKVMPLGLDSHCLIKRGGQCRIGILATQCSAQIDLFGAAQAGVELSGGGHPNAVAAFAEIVGQRSDEAEPAAGFRHFDIARRAAAAMRAVGQCKALLKFSTPDDLQRWLKDNATVV